MTEDTTTVQPAGQQVDTTSISAPSGAAINWEERYKGSSRTINSLTAERDQLTAKLTQAISENEQLRAQLGLKDTEKGVAISERDNNIQQLMQAKSQAEGELERLRTLELKLKVAKKINRPDLMGIADTIPNVNDENALEQLMRSVVDWGDTLVKQRETQIMAGITPPVGATQSTPVLPATVDSWQKYVNEVPFGSAEKQKRLDAFREWGMASMK